MNTFDNVARHLQPPTRVDVSAQEAMQHVTVNVNVRIVWTWHFRFRYWIGLRVLGLAELILGVGHIEVTEP